MRVHNPVTVYNLKSSIRKVFQFQNFLNFSPSENGNGNISESRGMRMMERAR